MNPNVAVGLLLCMAALCCLMCIDLSKPKLSKGYSGQVHRGGPRPKLPTRMSHPPSRSYMEGFNKKLAEWERLNKK